MRIVHVQLTSNEFTSSRQWASSCGRRVTPILDDSTGRMDGLVAKTVGVRHGFYPVNQPPVRLHDMIERTMGVENHAAVAAVAGREAGSAGSTHASRL